MTDENPYAPPEGELKLPEEDDAGRLSARERLNRLVGESWVRGGLWAAAGIVLPIIVYLVWPGSIGVVWMWSVLMGGRAAWLFWWAHQSKARLVETGSWDGALVKARQWEFLGQSLFRGVKEVIICLVMYFAWQRWMA